MVGLTDILPYSAAGMTLVSGVVGFFWARSGDRNKIGGAGWVALVLLVVSGLVTVVQTRVQAERGRQAEAKAQQAARKADQLSEDLRRSQFASSAALLTLIGDFDLSGAVGQGGFDFELDDRPAGQAFAPPGFIGPLPALPADVSAKLELWLDGVYVQAIDIEGQQDALTLHFHDSTAPPVVLKRSPDGFDFVGPPKSPAQIRQEESSGSETPEVWSASADLAEPSLTMDAPSSPRTYGFSFKSDGQFRRLVSQLVRQKEYGRITISSPRSDSAWVQRIVAGFAQVHSEFVFTPPLRPGKAADRCGLSFIRVPLTLQLDSDVNSRTVVFKLAPAPRGIQTEICEGGP